MPLSEGQVTASDAQIHANRLNAQKSTALGKLAWAVPNRKRLQYTQSQPAPDAIRSISPAASGFSDSIAKEAS